MSEEKSGFERRENTMVATAVEGSTFHSQSDQSLDSFPIRSERLIYQCIASMTDLITRQIERFPHQLGYLSNSSSRESLGLSRSSYSIPEKVKSTMKTLSEDAWTIFHSLTSLIKQRALASNNPSPKGNPKSLDAGDLRQQLERLVKRVQEFERASQECLVSSDMNLVTPQISDLIARLRSRSQSNMSVSSSDKLNRKLAGFYEAAKEMGMFEGQRDALHNMAKVLSELDCLVKSLEEVEIYERDTSERSSDYEEDPCGQELCAKRGRHILGNTSQLNEGALHWNENGPRSSSSNESRGKPYSNSSQDQVELAEWKSQTAEGIRESRLNKSLSSGIEQRTDPKYSLTFTDSGKGTLSSTDTEQVLHSKEAQKSYKLHDDSLEEKHRQSNDAYYILNNHLASASVAPNFQNDESQSLTRPDSGQWEFCKMERLVEDIPNRDQTENENSHVGWDQPSFPKLETTVSLEFCSSGKGLEQNLQSGSFSGKLSWLESSSNVDLPRDKAAASRKFHSRCGKQTPNEQTCKAASSHDMSDLYNLFDPQNNDLAWKESGGHISRVTASGKAQSSSQYTRPTTIPNRETMHAGKSAEIVKQNLAMQDYIGTTSNDSRLIEQEPRDSQIHYVANERSANGDRREFSRDGADRESDTLDAQFIDGKDGPARQRIQSGDNLSGSYDGRASNISLKYAGSFWTRQSTESGEDEESRHVSISDLCDKAIRQLNGIVAKSKLSATQSEDCAQKERGDSSEQYYPSEASISKKSSAASQSSCDSRRGRNIPTTAEYPEPVSEPGYISPRSNAHSPILESNDSSWERLAYPSKHVVSKMTSASNQTASSSNRALSGAQSNDSNASLGECVSRDDDRNCGLKGYHPSNSAASQNSVTRKIGKNVPTPDSNSFHASERSYRNPRKDSGFVVNEVSSEMQYCPSDNAVQRKHSGVSQFSSRSQHPLLDAHSENSQTQAQGYSSTSSNGPIKDSDDTLERHLYGPSSALSQKDSVASHDSTGSRRGRNVYTTQHVSGVRYRSPRSDAQSSALKSNNGSWEKLSYPSTSEIIRKSSLASHTTSGGERALSDAQNSNDCVCLASRNDVLHGSDSLGGEYHARSTVSQNARSASQCSSSSGTKWDSCIAQSNKDHMSGREYSPRNETHGPRLKSSGSSLERLSYSSTAEVSRKCSAASHTSSHNQHALSGAHSQGSMDSRETKYLSSTTASQKPSAVQSTPGSRRGRDISIHRNVSESGCSSSRSKEQELKDSDDSWERLHYSSGTELGQRASKSGQGISSSERSKETFVIYGNNENDSERGYISPRRSDKNLGMNDASFAKQQCSSCSEASKNISITSQSSAGSKRSRNISDTTSDKSQCHRTRHNSSIGEDFSSGVKENDRSSSLKSSNGSSKSTDTISDQSGEYQALEGGECSSVNSTELQNLSRRNSQPGHLFYTLEGMDYAGGCLASRDSSHGELICESRSVSVKSVPNVYLTNAHIQELNESRPVSVKNDPVVSHGDIPSKQFFESRSLLVRNDPSQELYESRSVSIKNGSTVYPDDEGTDALRAMGIENKDSLVNILDEALENSSEAIGQISSRGSLLLGRSSNFSKNQENHSNISCCSRESSTSTTVFDSRTSSTKHVNSNSAKGSSSSIGSRKSHEAYRRFISSSSSDMSEADKKAEYLASDKECIRGSSDSQADDSKSLSGSSSFVKKLNISVPRIRLPRYLDQRCKCLENLSWSIFPTVSRSCPSLNSAPRRRLTKWSFCSTLSESEQFADTTWQTLFSYVCYLCFFFTIFLILGSALNTKHLSISDCASIFFEDLNNNLELRHINGACV